MGGSVCPSPEQHGVQCDLCGQADFECLHEWLVGYRWNPATIPIAMWRCRGCGLVVLYPVPTQEQLPSHGDWWCSGVQQAPRRLWFKARWEAVRYSLFGDPRDRLIRATRKLVPRGRLLDVGCGTGEFLAKASRFYDCEGVELSPAAARRATARGFPDTVGTFEQADWERASYDLVTLDAVIEHFISPTAALMKINSLLQPGGVVVLKTPKFDGPSYRLHRAGWNGFRHGYHTFLFTGKTLGQLLNKTGFDVARRPRRDRMFDDLLILWGRKTSTVMPHSTSSQLAAAVPG